MPAPLWLPRFDPAHEQSRILRWLVAEGDVVLAGDPLCEVETDKVNMELEAPASGLMGPQRFPEGVTVPVVTAIAWVLLEGEQGAQLPPWPRGGDPEPIVGQEPVATSEPAPMPANASGDAVISVARAGSRVRATPAARHLARVRRVDLESLRGTGPLGRVQAIDVEQAGQLAEASNASVVLETSVDMSPLLALQDMWPEEELPLDRSALLAFACTQALLRNPALNAWKLGGRYVPQDKILPGLVAPCGDGHSVAVLETADSLSLRALLKAWPKMPRGEAPWSIGGASADRESFRICDLGERGPDRVAARTGPAAVASLGAGRTVWRHLSHDDGPAELRPAMALTLTIADGPGAPSEIQGARFLEDLVVMLENPLKLLLQGGRDAHRDGQ
ncbi:MAG: E3 binding domain-containing protein [Anaerolineaceae bacterium]|nr:E3 binding domain-containing protein [Anaerolineaceae bacterium]